jgi:peroxiredoxin
MVRTPSTMQPLGREAPAFSLPDVRTGATVDRDDFRGRPGLLVMFVCNHCPYVKHLRDALASFGREYGERGLGIVAISSNDPETHPDDAPDKMKEEAEAAGYPFPYCFDGTQEIAKAYGAACTPDFFLYDADLRLVYRGQFDETRPGDGRKPTGRDLRAAVDAVLAGRKPVDEQVPSIGCNIKWKPGNEPEWFGSATGGS